MKQDASPLHCYGGGELNGGKPGTTNEAPVILLTGDADQSRLLKRTQDDSELQNAVKKQRTKMPVQDELDVVATPGLNMSESDDEGNESDLKTKEQAVSRRIARQRRNITDRIINSFIALATDAILDKVKPFGTNSEKHKGLQQYFDVVTMQLKIKSEYILKRLSSSEIRKAPTPDPLFKSRLGSGKPDFTRKRLESVRTAATPNVREDITEYFTALQKWLKKRNVIVDGITGPIRVDKTTEALLATGGASPTPTKEHENLPDKVGGAVKRSTARHDRLKLLETFTAGDPETYKKWKDGIKAERAEAVKEQQSYKAYQKAEETRRRQEATDLEARHQKEREKEQRDGTEHIDRLSKLDDLISDIESYANTAT